MKRVMLYVIGFLMSTVMFTAEWSEGASLTPAPPSCPTCCETMKPSSGLSADDLMKLDYYIKFTKFAQDYTGIGFIKLIDKKGFTRTRDWGRYRIVLNKRSPLFDYKDLIVILGPQNIKGLSVLTWNYLDPQKDQEIWLWLPSLRKVRRVSQSEADDPFMGSEFTTEEMSTRKWEDETYRMIGEKKLEGKISRVNGKTYYKDTDCYVVEAVPKRKDWYYSKRIMWLDKGFGALLFDEVYDPAGRRWKTFIKEYDLWENGCIPQMFLEGEDQFSGHVTSIEFDKKDIKFNTNLEEGFFTEKTLMRSKW
jgi:hypothetical protein